MKTRILFLVIIGLCIGEYTFSQSKTVVLDEITVEGLVFEKYSSGSKIHKSDSIDLALLQHGTLADYMQRNTTVYIKEQGNRMLASVSFRGTGASHTAVLWHGININSLSLGSSDFNGVPMFLFDQIAVQYGGSSSLHGSDAIGGSIHLSSNESWIKGSKIQVRQHYGSFGNIMSGVKFNVGNGKWEYKTRAFYQGVKNNFKYQINDRIGNSHEIEQKNAEVKNYALLQEVNGKIGDNGVLSINAWLGTNEHQVQPLKASGPDELQSKDEIVDKNLRLMVEYLHYFPKGTLSSGLGYVWDYQLFNTTDLIEIRRSIANLSYEWEISDKTTINAGGITQYILPNVWSYADDLREWRGDVFLSAKQQIWKNGQVNVNARKTFVPFAQTPIAPSVSASYLIHSSEMDVKFRAQLERSYRVPTFNDRYWGNQGRKDLRAENGYSMELGHNLSWIKKLLSFELDIATYYMLVDDWIAWKQAGPLWRPYNLKQVEASGIELNSKFSFDVNKAKYELGGMYAYNRSILLKGVTEDDQAIGQQLPYTPIHRFGVNALTNYRSISAALDATYVGQRNGMDVANEKVSGYILTNITLNKNFQMGRHTLSLSGQVHNLFDVDYENIKRYAMPGRNYLISLNFLMNNQIK